MLKRNDYFDIGQKVNNWIQNYLENIESLPVRSQVKPGDIYGKLDATAPIEGEPFDKILADLNEHILPGITHWQHPNFHAYFPANASVESMMAENIVSAIGSQCMLWETSPVAAEMEQRMMEWLRDAIGLPKEMEGVIQDTASTATLVAILCAREKATNFKSKTDGVPPGLRVYASKDTHSSIDKAVAIAGIGTKNMVHIPVDENRAMDVIALQKAITKDKEQGLQPIAVVATFGSTSTLALDDLHAIAKVCNEEKIWFHIDAAYAGSALILEEYKHLITGVEGIDSFVFNPHKWLFMQFDCSAYFVRDVDTLIRSFEILPEYLKTKNRGIVNDYRDWGIQLGRRFRALKIWFVFRSYGLEGMKTRLREHIRLREYFDQQICGTGKYQLATPSQMSVSTFTLVPKTMDLDIENERNIKLLHHVNDRGKIYLTKTKINGKIILRMVISQTYVAKRHIDLAVEELHEYYE